MQTYTIGRDPTNQITLNDNFVSRYHAQLIITKDGKAFLKDLGSTNGSFVNGNKVNECLLKQGDIVKLGSAFLNWSQYLPGKTMIVPPMENKEMVAEQLESYTVQSIPEDISYTFSLGKTLKWLAIKVFDIGDLFKTNWNKTTSVLFFLLLPCGLFSMFLLYSFFQTQNNFFFQPHFGYQVLLPILLCVFIYGVSQFLTIGLLSIAKRAAFNKILLASSVFSFLQSIPAIIILFIAAIGLSSFDKMVHTVDNNVAYFFLIVFFTTLFILLFLTILIFIYNYFRAIGVSKGVSLHFVVLTLVINFLLQIFFVWIFSLIIRESFLHNFF